jgi:hypothetical protein
MEGGGGGEDGKLIGRCGKVVVDKHVTSSHISEGRELRALPYFVCMKKRDSSAAELSKEQEHIRDYGLYLGK